MNQQQKLTISSPTRVTCDYFGTLTIGSHCAKAAIVKKLVGTTKGENGKTQRISKNISP